MDSKLLFGIVEKLDGRLHFILPIPSLSIKRLWDDPLNSDFEDSDAVFDLNYFDSFCNIIGSGIGDIVPDRSMNNVDVQECKICTITNQDRNRDFINEYFGEIGDLDIYMFSIMFPYNVSKAEAKIRLSSIGSSVLTISHTLIHKYTKGKYTLRDVLETCRLVTSEDFYDFVQENLLLPGETLEIYDAEDTVQDFGSGLKSSSENIARFDTMFVDTIYKCVEEAGYNLKEDVMEYIKDPRHFIFNDLGVVTAAKMFADAISLEDLEEEIKKEREKTIVQSQDSKMNNVTQMIYNIIKEEEVCYGNGKRFRNKT